MNRYKGIAALLTACLFAVPVMGSAAENTASNRTAESVLAEWQARHQGNWQAEGEMQQGSEQTSEQASQDTGLKSEDTLEAQAAQVKEADQKIQEKWKADTKAKAKKEKKAQERYVKLLNDNGYDYLMDTENARWIPMPHSGNEYIADVWIRLNSDGTKDEKGGSYQYPQAYYLEHYYIRPKTQQIQFLCELEVTGRPDNAIQERAYSVQNWENLVPGSIEDDIYHTVLKNMQKNKLLGTHSAGKSVRDIIEDKLNIAL